MKENSKYPFPFFGAGNAEYFEWASITIRFLSEPTDADKQKIIKLAPEPLKPEEDSFNGRMMSALSDQYVNMWIEEEYGNEENEEEMDEESDPEFYASDEAKEAFEKDLENWLKEVHTFCPIEFVFRAEDGEAGGTVLSDWHTNSLQFINQLVEKWTSDPALATQQKDEAEYFDEAAVGILEFSGIDRTEINAQLARILLR